MMWARRGAVAVALAVAAATLSGCGSSDDPTQGWDEPASYAATIRYQAYDIDAGTYRIIVTDHVVTSFVRTDHRGDVPVDGRGPDPDYFTLRQIVGRYQAARTHGESYGRIEFDEQGMPMFVTIDWEPYRITDEQTWHISDIEIR